MKDLDGHHWAHGKSLGVPMQGSHPLQTCDCSLFCTGSREAGLKPTCTWIFSQSSSVISWPHLSSSCWRMLRFTAKQRSISEKSSSMLVLYEHKSRWLISVNWEQRHRLEHLNDRAKPFLKEELDFPSLQKLSWGPTVTGVPSSLRMGVLRET